ncbi:hypothetical protein NQ315_013580 [Exocentrus adspersus]|uniref:Uncharacterized protein n=1 Tax=Exocentrus adspersus TaxID=1586481 RepID=A0AAV8V792_9CUCU|nr:hypothetical protein NQ315_013580 [Exocentrus adspersus]
MDILNITQPPLVDNSIIDLEYHNYQPFVTSTFEYNDEIRIPIQELDAYTLPCESILYLEVTKLCFASLLHPDKLKP